MLLQVRPVPFQRIEKSGIVMLCQLRTTDNDKVKTIELVLMAAKALPNDSFDAVAHYGGFGRFSGDSQTKAGKSEMIGLGKDRKVTVPGSDGLCEDVLEIGFVDQPGAPIKARTAHDD